MSQPQSNPTKEAVENLEEALLLTNKAKFKLASVNHTQTKAVDKVRGKLNIVVKNLKSKS